MQNSSKDITIGQLAVEELLDTFEELPVPDLIVYLQNRGITSDGEKLLRNLVYARAIKINTSNWCSRYGLSGINAKSGAAFSLFNKLEPSVLRQISRAAYPFDYIFQVEKIMFQMIDYGDNGIYKMNFRKQQWEPDNRRNPVQIIPVIYAVNQDVDSAGIEDDLRPKGPYIVARVDYADGHFEPKMKVYNYEL